MTTFPIYDREGAAVVSPEGRLDLMSAGDMRSLLDDLIAGGSRRIVVDLAGITVLDSSGLGALIGGLRAARQAGGDLRIARPNEQALLVLELTKLDRVLRAHPDVDSALE